MATIDETTLQKLCQLAHLLPASDTSKQRHELEQIASMFEALQRIDTSEIDLKSSDSNETPLRADEITEIVDCSTLQQQAPTLHEGAYLVPSVIDDGKEG